MIVDGFSIGNIVSCIVGITVLITFLWNGLGRPNIDQNVKIQSLENDTSQIKKDLTIIKVNHLTHIERDVNFLKEGLVRVETILEERLPKR